MASTLPHPPVPDLEALYARVAEIERAGARMLAAAAELREGLDRVSVATGVPLLPVRPHLSAVPPLAG